MTPTGGELREVRVAEFLTSTWSSGTTTWSTSGTSSSTNMDSTQDQLWVSLGAVAGCQLSCINTGWFCSTWPTFYCWQQLVFVIQHGFKDGSENLVGRKSKFFINILMKTFYIRFNLCVILLENFKTFYYHFDVRNKIMLIISNIIMIRLYTYLYWHYYLVYFKCQFE